MRSTQFFMLVVMGGLLFIACKKKELNDGPGTKQAFLPRIITISGAIIPDLNGTVQFTYNANRQMTGIKRIAKSGNEELNWSYTYDSQNRLTRTRFSLDNALSSPSHYQTDYTYEYTGDFPAKVTAVFTNNLGDNETQVENITRPEGNRFTLWASNYTYTLNGDLAAGSGSLYDGWNVAATYSDNMGVFADVTKQEAQHFFLNRQYIADILFLSKKELKAIKIDGHPSTTWAGNYTSVTAERNAQNRIARYVIKNETKTYAQFDIEYTIVQP